MSRLDEPTTPAAVADAKQRIRRAHTQRRRCHLECPQDDTCAQYVWALETTPEGRPAA